MKPLRKLAVSLAFCAAPAAAQGDEDASALGHALTLVHTFVSIAAHAESAEASAKAFDEVLAGRDPQANQAAAGLLAEMTADMPARHRDKVGAIGRDLVALARSSGPGNERRKALQARKDLAEMGLRYYDDKQFLDAVKRDDALAVELYIAGQGVDLSSRDAQGRSALEIARANGNQALAGLLARNLRAAR